MRLAMFPGSFNPWHEGHADVLKKALKIFDQVVIAIGVNPDKEQEGNALNRIPKEIQEDRRINVVIVKGLLVNAISEHKPVAVVRGIRNGADLEYERTQQYWNEDLGMKVPTAYFVTDRKLIHISSSAIRQLDKVRTK